jgi:glycosyltransferase involved in cell wall biosynthesis
MPRRRLLFYTHALVGGGGERVWALVASGLSRRGHDVTFAVDFAAYENDHLIAPEVRRFALGQHHSTATRALARLLVQERPDVAFSSIGASNVKLLAAKALSGWRGAAVLSAHGRFDAESRLLGRWSYAATAITSRLSARTIAVSDDLRGYLVDRFRGDRERVVTIHNGIALPLASSLPDSAALAARDDVVLGVGRLVPEKGFASLIDAIAKSKRAKRLVLLGEGPERARLEEKIAREGLAPRVELRGYLKEPSPAFSEAKMLALASRSEAFGNVLVEALAHGLPVVATRCSGPQEILDGGRFGRLVPIDNSDAMAQAIDETLANPGDPAQHRTRAEVFSLDRALDKFEELIERILAERS